MQQFLNIHLIFLITRKPLFYFYIFLIYQFSLIFPRNYYPYTMTIRVLIYCLPLEKKTIKKNYLVFCSVYSDNLNYGTNLYQVQCIMGWPPRDKSKNTSSTILETELKVPIHVIETYISLSCYLCQFLCPKLWKLLLITFYNIVMLINS